MNKSRKILKKLNPQLMPVCSLKTTPGKVYLPVCKQNVGIDGFQNLMQFSNEKKYIILSHNTVTESQILK